jgi:hypothetical protein
MALPRIRPAAQQESANHSGASRAVPFPELLLGRRSESTGRHHRTPWPLLSRMELESGDGAPPFRGCRSEAGADRALPDAWCSSRAGASRTGTRALASGWKRVRERKTGCSPVPLDVGMADALPLAKCRVLAAPDAGPALAAPPASPSRERPDPRQCRRVSRTCSFRSHVATSTAGFELARRCRFERPQRLPGCGSRREAWRGSRRRGWRRCSGSARGLARSRGCSCRWRVA